MTFEVKKTVLENRVAIMPVSLDLLVAILGLPDDTEIISVTQGGHGVVNLTVMSPQLPPVPPRHFAPTVTPILQVSPDARPDGSWLKFSWDGAEFFDPGPIDIPNMSRMFGIPLRAGNAEGGSRDT